MIIEIRNGSGVHVRIIRAGFMHMLALEILQISGLNLERKKALMYLVVAALIIY